MLDYYLTTPNTGTAPKADGQYWRPPLFNYNPKTANTKSFRARARAGPEDPNLLIEQGNPLYLVLDIRPRTRGRGDIPLPHPGWGSQHWGMGRGPVPGPEPCTGPVYTVQALYRAHIPVYRPCTGPCIQGSRTPVQGSRTPGRGSWTPGPDPWGTPKYP